MAINSAAVSELERQLRDGLTSQGEIEVSWVGKLIGLMGETRNLEGRAYLLKIISAMSDSATITRFVQQDGLGTLSSWITEHVENDETDTLICLLHSLIKVDFPYDSIGRYKLREKITRLTNHIQSRVADLCTSVLAKWDNAAKQAPTRP
jgi:hypothetical protein